MVCAPRGVTRRSQRIRRRGKSKGWGLLNLAVKNGQRGGRESDLGQEKPEPERKAQVAKPREAGRGLLFVRMRWLRRWRRRRRTVSRRARRAALAVRGRGLRPGGKWGQVLRGLECSQVKKRASLPPAAPAGVETLSGWGAVRRGPSGHDGRGWGDRVGGGGSL